MNGSLGENGYVCVWLNPSAVCLNLLQCFYFFIFYILLRWVFIVVHGTSLVVNHGLCRVCVFTDCSTQTSLFAVCRFGCPVACGILVPQPGIEPASPALEDRFLTTGPPGKSHVRGFIYLFIYFSCQRF